MKGAEDNEIDWRRWVMVERGGRRSSILEEGARWKNSGKGAVREWGKLTEI